MEWYVYVGIGVAIYLVIAFLTKKLPPFRVKK